MAAQQSSHPQQPELALSNASTNTTTTENKRIPLEPEPVSKHNLYVIFGCAALVPILVLLGPYIYPLIQEFNPFGF